MSVHIHRTLRCDFCSDSEFVPPRSAYDQWSLREQAEVADWACFLVDAAPRDKCPDCRLVAEVA